jgi:hypothetical protein
MDPLCSQVMSALDQRRLGATTWVDTYFILTKYTSKLCLSAA